VESLSSLPIYVSLLLLAKAAKGLLALMKPITDGIPASLEFCEILAVLVLAAVCFVAGLIARTGPGLRAKNAFDKAVLERLPGHTLLRGLAARFTGQADGPTFAPALVEIEENWRTGLIRCWCRRCQRQWPDRSTFCRPSVCIGSMCRLPQH
jgi:hypothetical protein